MARARLASASGSGAHGEVGEGVLSHVAGETMSQGVLARYAVA